MRSTLQRSGIQPGDVVDGKYRVERVLGQGGMGIVVAATNPNLEQVVALKLMLPEAARSPDAVERFLREARASARLRSEHVGRVMDVGILASGLPYMVMECLVGTDLADLVHREGALPVSEAADYILQACEALAEAHAIGLIHRDIKPGNLFRTRRPDGSHLIKVLDFGIAKSLDRPDQTKLVALTERHVVMGSPVYMSPEQLASSRDVDARADIWALGVVLYELVTGRVPFLADSLTALCLCVTNDPVPPMQLPRGKVSESFRVLVERCLSKAPAQRFPNIAELARALAPHAPPHARAAAHRIAHVQGGEDALRATATPQSLVADMTPTRHLRSTTLGGASGEPVGRPSPGMSRWRQRVIASALAAAGLSIGVLAGFRVLPQSTTPNDSAAGSLQPTMSAIEASDAPRSPVQLDSKSRSALSPDDVAHAVATAAKEIVSATAGPLARAMQEQAAADVAEHASRGERPHGSGSDRPPAGSRKETKPSVAKRSVQSASPEPMTPTIPSVSTVETPAKTEKRPPDPAPAAGEDECASDDYDCQFGS